MPLTTLSDESKLQGAFYSPRFEVRIQGAGLPRDVVRDITQITYKDNIKEIDSFEMTVNNWDPTTRTFKYVGSETTASLGEDTRLTQLHRLFEPGGKDVEVRMGYLEELTIMLTGRLTTMEPNFPAGGAPTLSVRGLNVLHKLRNRQYTYAWTKEKPSAIASNIATLRDPDHKGKRRFPLPIEIDQKTLAGETSIDYLAQSNQYDIDFLLNLARKYAYVVVVLEGDPKAAGIKKEKRLYFGPSQGGQGTGLRDVTFRLGWGRTLVDFKPTLTTANQVKSVTVNGWDRKTRKPIKVTVSIDDKKLNLNKDLHALFAEKFDPREEIVVDKPVFSPAEAKQLALAMLTDRQKEMVKATGTTVGLPDLRAGRRMLIENIGARFSGTYFVTDTTHTIGEGGYTTRFSARREDGGKDSSLEAT